MPYELETVLKSEQHLPAFLAGDKKVLDRNILGEQFKARTELEAKQNETQFQAKDVEAWFRASMQENIIASGVEKLNQSTLDARYEKDDLFINNYSADMRVQDLLENGLDPSTYLPRLNDVKNERHRLRILDDLKEKQRINTFINEQISDASKMSAVISGTLVDFDTLLIGPASLLIKGKRLSKLAGLSAGLEGAGVAAKAQLKDDYDVLSDGLADMVIGTFMNTAIAKYASMGKVSEDVRSSPTNMDTPLLLEYKPNMSYHVNDIEGTDFYAKGENITSAVDFKTTYKSIKRNLGKDEAEQFRKGYQDGIKRRGTIKKKTEMDARVEARNTEIKKLEDSLIISRGKNKGQPKKLSKNKKEEIEAKIKMLKGENEIEGTLTMEQKLEQIKLEEIKARQSEKELTDNEVKKTWKQKRKDRAKILNDEKRAIQAEKDLKELEVKADNYRKKLEVKKADELEEARLKELDRKKARLKYTEDLKKNSTGLKHFFRQQDELVEQATKEVDARLAQKKIDAIKEFEDLVLSLGDTVEKSLARLGRRLENGTINIEDATKAVKLLKEQYPEEYKIFKSIEKYLEKHRSKDIATGGKILDDIVSKFKNLNKMQKAGLVSLLLFAPSASFADDGTSTEDILTPSLIGLVVLASISPVIANKFMNGTLKQAVLDTTKSISRGASNNHYSISGRGKGVHKLFDNIHKGMSTGFNSSFKGFMIKINSRLSGEHATFAKDLIKKMLFNPLNGKVTFDSAKTQMVKETVSKPNLAYKQAYKNYTRKFHGRVGSFFKSVTLEKEFNDKVVDMVEGRIAVEEGFEEVVSEVKAMFKKGLDDAVEAGVMGAEEALKRVRGDYFPRIWKFTELKHILNVVSDSDKMKIIEALAKGMDGGNTIEKSQALLEWVQKSDFSTKLAKSDNTMATLEDFLEDVEDVDLNKLRELLADPTQASGRFKNKIRIDWNKVELPQIELKGEVKQLEIDDFVDRNVRDVLDMYANDIYGKIHIKQTMGYNSVQELREAINTRVFDPEINKEMHIAVDILLNKPIYDELSTIRELTEIAKGMAFLASMPYVAFSMGVEVAKTVANSGLSNTLKAFKHQIGGLDKNTLEFQLLENSGGLGTHNNMARFDYKGLDQGAADESVHWGLTMFIRKAQQNLAKASGLIDVSDITQKANYLHHATEFAKLTKGKDSALVKSRFESYGIDDETLTMFQDKFQFNAKGDLLAFDKAEWSLVERTKFNDVMLRLNQEISPEVMVGTTGLWQRTPLGKIASFLIGYPINLFENQAVKDAHYMDLRTLSNFTLTFGASYLGMVAKYEALGRDYEDKDLIAYSFLNTPSMAVISAIMAMGDNAVMSTASDIKHNVEALTLEPIKEVF